MATDPQPTREGVVLHRDAPPVVPERPKRLAQWRYREMYDTDPIVIWHRTPEGWIGRFTVAGPLSARAMTTKWVPGSYTVHWAAEAPTAATV